MMKRRLLVVTAVFFLSCDESVNSSASQPKDGSTLLTAVQDTTTGNVTLTWPEATNILRTYVVIRSINDTTTKSDELTTGQWVDSLSMRWLGTGLYGPFPASSSATYRLYSRSSTAEPLSLVDTVVVNVQQPSWIKAISHISAQLSIDSMSGISIPLVKWTAPYHPAVSRFAVLQRRDGEKVCEVFYDAPGYVDGSYLDSGICSSTGANSSRRIHNYEYYGKNTESQGHLVRLQEIIPGRYDFVFVDNRIDGIPGRGLYPGPAQQWILKAPEWARWTTLPKLGFTLTDLSITGNWLLGNADGGDRWISSDGKSWENVPDSIKGAFIAKDDSLWCLGIIDSTKMSVAHLNGQGKWNVEIRELPDTTHGLVRGLIGNLDNGRPALMAALIPSEYLGSGSRGFRKVENRSWILTPTGIEKSSLHQGIMWEYVGTENNVQAVNSFVLGDGRSITWLPSKAHAYSPDGITSGILSVRLGRETELMPTELTGYSGMDLLGASSESPHYFFRWNDKMVFRYGRDRLLGNAWIINEPACGWPSLEPGNVAIFKGAIYLLKDGVVMEGTLNLPESDI